MTAQRGNALLRNSESVNQPQLDSPTKSSGSNVLPVRIDPEVTADKAFRLFSQVLDNSANVNGKFVRKGFSKQSSQSFQSQGPYESVMLYLRDNLEEGIRVFSYATQQLYEGKSWIGYKRSMQSELPEEKQNLVNDFVTAAEDLEMSVSFYSKPNSWVVAAKSGSNNGQLQAPSVVELVFSRRGSKVFRQGDQCELP